MFWEDARPGPRIWVETSDLVSPEGPPCSFSCAAACADLADSSPVLMGQSGAGLGSLWALARCSGAVFLMETAPPEALSQQGLAR